MLGEARSQPALSSLQKVRERSEGIKISTIDKFITISAPDAKYSHLQVGNIVVKMSEIPGVNANLKRAALPPLDREECNLIRIIAPTHVEDHPFPQELRGMTHTSIADLVESARNYEIEKDYAAALCCLDTILTLEPENFDGLFRSGRIYEKLGSLGVARKYALAAFEVRPKHYRAAVTLARIAMKEKRFDLALHYYSMVRPEHDTYYEACSSSARALGNLDRLSEALPFLEEAYKKKPKKLAHLEHYAQTARKLGKIEEANSAYKSLRLISEKDYSSEIRDISDVLTGKKELHPASKFRRAFSASKFACICCGSKAREIAFAEACAETMGIQMGCSVEVRPAGREVQTETAELNNSDSIEYEFSFLLPEALLQPGFEPPRATFCLSYLEDHRLESLSADRLEKKYAKWICSITGLNGI